MMSMRKRQPRSPFLDNLGKLPPKNKPFWILIMQEMTGGIWTICKLFKLCYRHITMRASYHATFTSHMLFPAQNWQWQLWRHQNSEKLLQSTKAVRWTTAVDSGKNLWKR